MQGLFAILGFLRKTLAVILAIFVVIFLPVSLFFSSTGRILSSPEKISSIITGQITESDALYRWMIGQNAFEESMSTADMQPLALVRHLQPDEQLHILKQLIPPHWVGEQLSRVLDDLYSWLNSEDLKPELMLTTDGLWRNMDEARARDIIHFVSERLPECSAEQFTRMIRIFEDGNPPRLDCVPADADMRAVLIDSATWLLLDTYRGLPPDIPLMRSAEFVDSAQITDLKVGWYLLQNILAWLWLVPLLMLTVIVILVVRSWYQLAAWWGWTTAAGGFFTLLFASLVPRLETRFLTIITNQVELPRIVLSGFVHPIIKDIFLRIQTDVLAGAWLILILDIILLVVLLINRRRRHPATTVGQPAGLNSTDPRDLPPAIEKPADKPPDKPLKGMFG